MSTFSVIWHEKEIGSYSVTAIDMWYWDGIFTANESFYASEFVKLAMALDMKAVFKDATISTWVLLRPADETLSPTYALVNGMTSETDLHVRILYDAKAIQWLIENVDVRH